MSNDFSEQQSILKQTRIDQGLSLEMVHEATKIPLDVLRAIEEGYKVRTLSPFYYNAFIKTYAKYLDVDPDMAVNQFKEQESKKGMRLTTKPPPKKEFVPPKSKLSKEMEKYWTPQRRAKVLKIIGGLIALFIALKVLVFIVGAFGGWIQSWGEKSNDTVVKQPVLESVSVMPNTNKTLLPKTEKQKESAASEPVLKSEAVSTPKPQAKKETPPARTQPVAQTNQTSSTAPISAGVTVTVRATRDAFLIVKADGSTVFQSSLFKGAVETWNATEKIVISGKNIGYLEFEVNGRMIGGLSRGDSKAKKVTITENGLSVQK